MKRLTRYLFIFFSTLFLLIFLLMLAKGVGSFERPIMKDIFLVSVVSIPLIIILVSQRHLFKNRKFVNVKILTTMFFITILAINIICALKLSNFIQPVSDFELAYNKAIKFSVNTQYDLYYPWWTNFSIFLGIVFKLFGSNLIVVAIMNSILSTSSCFFIYLTAKRHLRFSQAWSLFVALVFAIYPSRLFFLPFVAPDFIAEFGFVLITFLFFNYLDLFSASRTTKKAYIYPPLLAILVFFFSLFKPMQEIFLILFAIILVIKSLPNFRNFSKRLAYFFLVFLCLSFGSNFVHAKFFQSHTGIKLDKNLVLMNKLYVGLNSEGRGYWNPVNEKYLSYLEKTYSTDTSQITQAMRKKLIANIKQNPNFSKMIIDKLDTAFISDFYGIEWVNLSLKSGRIDLMDLERPVYVSNLYYYLVLFFALFSVIDIIKTKDFKKLYFVVFLLGFTAVVLIGESQTRYKLAFLFNFIYLASIGIKYIAEYPIKQKIKIFLKEN